MIKIILDPGHGDPDPGALGSMSREADINLSVALTAQKYLKTYGYIPILTRDTNKRIFKDNRTIDLSARANVANRINGDCFVSFHCNAAENRMANGFEIYTTLKQNNSDKLATCIYNEWVKAFPDQRKRVDFRDGDPDKEANFKVIRETRCPSCLIELAFITNPREELFLINAENQDLMGAAIATGIHNFIEGMKG